MDNSGRISEQVRIDHEAYAPTTAAAASKLYDMQKFSKICLIGDVYSTLGVNGQVVDLVESSNSSVAGTSAAGGKAGIEIGSTVTTNVPVTRGAVELLLTPATVTGAITLSLGTVSKKYTHTTISTLLTTLATAVPPSTAWTATAGYFGSTIDSTSDGSLQAHAETLRVALQDAKYGFGGLIACSTPSTIQLTVASVEGTASLGFNSTAATVMTGLVSRAQVVFNVEADDLTSTANKRYVGLAFTTQATTAVRGVVSVRGGGRYGAGNSGRVSS